MLQVEFTVEPFVEGQPGPHVTAAVHAVEALGGTVEFGPFGTSCTLADDTVPDAVAALIRAAFANGASYVSLHVGELRP